MIEDIKNISWSEAGCLLASAIFLVACLVGAGVFWWRVLT